MLRFRPAIAADAARLFEWRNDPLTRAMSRSVDPVPWEDHVRWLDARLGRPNPRLYVVELGGHPVGTFRIDDREVSYTVAPDDRGKGLATAMLKMVRDEFGPLSAEIYSRNLASIKAATSAGLTVILLTANEQAQ